MRPAELPGRYGRVIRDIERLLAAVDSPGVVAGGWAVWRHGYIGRVTQDVDLVIPAASQAGILDAGPLFGFDVLNVPDGVWPKLTHRETAIEVDLLPEGGIPGTAARPAPVPIRHPSEYGARRAGLEYIRIAGLFELKLGAHRARDMADLVELIKVNPGELDGIRMHLEQVHPLYSQQLAEIIRQAADESL